MWGLKLLLILLATYAVVVLVAYAAQTSLLFPTTLARNASALSANASHLACDTPDGERLEGIRIPPVEGSAGGAPVLIGFGGNACNAASMANYLHDLFPAAEIVAFHYRGYRPSTGRPSAAALLSDASLVYDCALERKSEATVVAVGFSIGSGVAAHLASRRLLAGVILVTPFDELRELARQHYRWLPTRLLLRHHMSPVSDLRAVSAPVALIAAERDTIIPPPRTEPLREAARDLIMDVTIKGVGHNDIYGDSEFSRTMREALKLILERASRARSAAPGATPA